MTQQLTQKKSLWPLQLILVSYLSLECRSISGWVVFTEICKTRKCVKYHNNIQTVTFTNDT